jgi:hypothetical protein
MLGDYKRMTNGAKLEGMDKTTPTTEAREKLKATLEAAVKVTTAEISPLLAEMLAVKALNPEPSDLEQSQIKMPVCIFDFDEPRLTAVHQQIGGMVKDAIHPIGMLKRMSAVMEPIDKMLQSIFTPNGQLPESLKSIAVQTQLTESLQSIFTPNGQLPESLKSISEQTQGSLERIASMAQNIRIDAGKRFEILNDSLSKAKARDIRLEQTYGKAYQAASSRKEEIPALEERLLAGVSLQSLTLEDLYLTSYIGLNGETPRLRQNVALEIARRKIKARCQLLIAMFGQITALFILENTKAFAPSLSTRAPPNPFTKFQHNAQPNAPNLTTAS